MLQELNLPPLQEHRKQQWLTTLYKIVKGHIPAMPPENFFQIPSCHISMLLTHMYSASETNDLHVHCSMLLILGTGDSSVV